LFHVDLFENKMTLILSVVQKRSTELVQIVMYQKKKATREKDFVCWQKIVLRWQCEDIGRSSSSVLKKKLQL